MSKKAFTFRPGASVLVESEERRQFADVSADGTFEVKSVLPGTYTLKSMEGDLLTEPVEVTLTSEDEPAQIEIPGLVPASVQVRVTVPQGRPLDDVRVGAVGPDGSKPRFGLSRLAPGRGKFTAGRLRPGRYRVRAELSGHNSQETTLELKEGQDPKLEFTFKG